MQVRGGTASYQTETFGTMASVGVTYDSQTAVFVTVPASGVRTDSARQGRIQRCAFDTRLRGRHLAEAMFRCSHNGSRLSVYDVATSHR